MKIILMMCIVNEFSAKVKKIVRTSLFICLIKCEAFLSEYDVF